jgi:division protein CdvB (Snf7/Vps24/ESCRT-III family)
MVVRLGGVKMPRLLDVIRRKKPPAPMVRNGGHYAARLSSALLSLNTQIGRLKNKYAGLEARGKEYFERCVQALQAGDEGYAAIYANEIAELRRIARIVLQSLLVLEQVRVRMESLIELRDIIGLAPVLKGLLEVVRSEIVKVVPEAAASLDELSSAIDGLVGSSGVQPPLPEYEREALSDEAMRILEEARAIIAKKVAESFPEVPTLSREERVVYEYIKSLPEGSVLDVGTCSVALGMPEEEVESVLRRLEEKGLIEVASQMESPQ